MLVALLVLLMFVLIGVMTYYVIKGKTMPILGSGDQRLGIKIDTIKLKNKVFVREVNNIIKNLNSIQSLACEEYKETLRAHLKKMNEAIMKEDDVNCTLLQTSMNEMLGRMNVAYETLPNGDLRLITYEIMNSTTKIVEELLLVLCDENTQKIDKIAVFKVFENAVNTICNLGGDVI